MKGLSPRVLLVEEAGQVMEAHILGSLVPSIEHLILIGDPLQLRPTLNNYCEFVIISLYYLFMFSSSLHGEQTRAGTL